MPRELVNDQARVLVETAAGAARWFLVAMTLSWRTLLAGSTELRW